MSDKQPPKDSKPIGVWRGETMPKENPEWWERMVQGALGHPPCRSGYYNGAEIHAICEHAQRELARELLDIWAAGYLADDGVGAVYDKLRLIAEV